MSVKKNKKTSGVILITKDNLPLSCPRDNYLKLSHPKIFLPIEKEDYFVNVIFLNIVGN